MLTSIVEKASGSSFIEFLNFELLGPLGIHDVDVGATAENGRKPKEVSSYDDDGASPAQTDMRPGAVAPNAYGGTFVLENGEGAGGLITSTLLTLVVVPVVYTFMDTLQSPEQWWFVKRFRGASKQA